MGRTEQPYLYDAPQNRRVAYPYSDFNPKAATQAAYQTLVEQSRPKPKREGPLINFNQHPDSYVIVPGTRVHHEPMPTNTKKKVAIIRWVQFGLRVLTELAALGMLVATICITNTEGAVTYLLRIPAALDALVTLYAIYHLLRPAKERTPGSSASYHFFALFMDVGLCPLYAYIALVANQTLVQPVTDESRWSSFFNRDDALNKILFSIFAGAVAIGGVHVVSAIIDIWLIILFRKISNLPPDMNPLEDNLTGRSNSLKHKYKNSEVSLQSTSTYMTANEKGPAHLSTSTLSTRDGARYSPIKDNVDANSRPVPFGHSRLNSDPEFSPHNPDSARWSRQRYDEQQTLYDEVMNSASQSRWERSPERRRNPAKSQPLSNPSFTTEHQDSFIGQTGAGHGHVAPAASGSPANVNVQQEQKRGLLNDSWYVSDRVKGAPEAEGRRMDGRDISRRDYAARTDRHDSFQPSTDPNGAFIHQPLKMNPPTPPLQHELYPDPSDDMALRPEQTDIDRSGTIHSHKTGSSVYSESAPSLDTRSKNGTPKGKYYGDLASATMGVRGTSPDKSPAARLGPYGLPSPQASRSPSPPKRDGPGRVVSRTGVDIADADLQLPDQQHGYGMRNRRDVSGKIAEEGRGGIGANQSWAGGRIFR